MRRILRIGAFKRTVIAALFVFGAAGAWALDITSCYVTVPANEIGVLQADLACQPGDFHAVALENGSTLELNGHTISNPGHFASGAAVRCHGRCVVVGPGLISGAPAREFDGIRADASLVPHPPLRLELHDLTIDSTRVGIDGPARNPFVRATNVTVSNSALYGFYIARVHAENVTATGSEIGVYSATLKAVNLNASNNAAYGVYVLRSLLATGLVVTDNAGEGILADGRIRLVDSTVTGNDIGGEGIDIESARRPRLINTTCGRSERTTPPFGDWDICAND
jgi:hypothetical protein